MNGVAINFDANQVEPRSAIEVLPDGWYPVKIIESGTKETKQKDGWYLELTMEVLSGQYAGQRLWDRLNLGNPNPAAVEIGYRTLSAVCRATGVMQIQTTAALHGHPMEVKAVVVPATAEYAAKNDVKGYRPVSGGAAPSFTPPGAPAAAPTSAPPPPAAAPAADGPSFTPPGTVAAPPPPPTGAAAPPPMPGAAPAAGASSKPPWER